MGGIAKGDWELDPSERCDFNHRIRTFPEAVSTWRSHMVEAITHQTGVYCRLRAGTEPSQVRALLDDAISTVRELARILALVYESPRRLCDPVDALVSSILEAASSTASASIALKLLKKTSWSAAIQRSSHLSQQLGKCGIPQVARRQVFMALRSLRKDFGRCTLAPAEKWPDRQLEEYLRSISGLGQARVRRIIGSCFRRSELNANVMRVLKRLCPFSGLGFDADVVLQSSLPKILMELIPPNLRTSLCSTLDVHARQVCRSHVPQCGACPIRQFCQAYRRKASQRTAAASSPTVVDLFCGAGGISQGFSRAGFKILLALDNDPVALKTYRLNHAGMEDSRIICADIAGIAVAELRRRMGRRRPDVLVGAPPCQGFSSAGCRSKRTRTGYRPQQDRRNYLYEYMVAAAIDLKPHLFLMENVPGMNSARKETTSFLDSAVTALKRHGYQTAIWKLNAAVFGVPQDRVRCFLIASTDGAMPTVPSGDYQDIRRASFDVDALPPVTFEEATFDLPPVSASSGEAVTRHRTDGRTLDGRYRRYLGKYGLVRDSQLIFNHACRYHNERDLELYELLRPGEDSVHALERHGRGDLMRYRRDVFDDKYSRLRSNRPCKTIVAHLAKDGNAYIHPSQPRSITLREAARVQSFHDDFVFCGSPSDQWIQVGNAVPPLLAEAIARSFLSVLRRRS